MTIEAIDSAIYVRCGSGDGPLYFAAHGFWGRAVLVLALNFVLIGFIVAPFLAYPAWRERAREKAERAIAAGVDV